MEYTSEVAIAVRRNPSEALTNALKKLSLPLSLPYLAPKVIVKPSVYDPHLPGNTSPLLLRAIAKTFHMAGDIFVVESDNPVRTGNDALREAGYENIVFNDVQLLNLSNLDSETVSLPNTVFKQIKIPSLLLQDSFLVNVPTLKIDPHLVVGGGIKNLFGFLPEREKNIYHRHLEDLLLALLQTIPPQLTIMDLTEVVIGPRETRETEYVGGVIVSTDTVAVDSYAISLLGFDPLNIPLLRRAHELDLGEALPDRIRVVGTNYQKQKLIAKMYEISQHIH